MHVLLVEDEQMLASYLRRGLEEQGYAVDVAHTGTDALDWLQTASFDLVVLDLMLPGRDGLSVCREVRSRGLATPILMLTARGGVDDRVAGLDAGADDYLIKPFAISELLARLRALTRRHGDQPSAIVLQVADLAFDTRTLRVVRSGQEIELVAKEYAVLECLMRAAGRVLTREMIGAQVWSYSVYHASNVVDVYIRNLRRKIDDPFERKLIQTVRGIGYRLVAEDAEAP